MLEGLKQNHVCTRTQKKGTVIPQETEPDLPLSVQESLVEAWVDSGLPQGQQHWIQQSWELQSAGISSFEEGHKSFWITTITPTLGFPHCSVGKEYACHAGDLASIPGLGRSPGEGNGNPLQYNCLENPMDRGAWQAIVHGVARVGHNLATKPSPPYHSWASGQTTGREHSPAHQQKSGLKIYWAWPHTSEQDPDSPTASPSH